MADKDTKKDWTKAELHIGMNSGAGFQFTGPAAEWAYDAIAAHETESRPSPFVKVVNRPGFEQHINANLIESIDWYPDGILPNG